MRRFLLLLLVMLLTTPAFALATTAAEQAANRAAQHELDSAPRDGNLPSYHLPPDALAKGAHLEHLHTLLHFGGALWSVVQLLLLLALGVIAGFQRAVVRRFRNRWLQGYGFLLLFSLAGGLLDLPLTLLHRHLELRYGLSVQSWASWWGDQAKAFAIEWLLGGLIVMLLFFIIRRFPRRWWLVFWAAAIPITLAGIFASPYVFEPLFNRFEPLQQTHPELVTRLEQVAQRGHMNIPPERMFLMKASDKVTTLNAYVSGFGASKRVVVWDTSIAKGTPDEILFIFGHESGHYVLHHIVRGTLITFCFLFVLLYAGYHFVRWAIARYGRAWGIASQNDWGAFAIVLLAFTLMSFALEPVQSTLTRMQEHAADVYGQEAVHGIVADPQSTGRGAFQVLGETSFDDPNPSQWIEFWTYSHPSIGRRAAFAAHYDPWAAGMTPKYFPKQ